MIFKNKKTFTLIEMLIVVVIIGIIAASLIPRLQNTQARTRDMIRKKDIKTAADAIAVYYQDNQKFTPINNNDTGTRMYETTKGLNGDFFASGGILTSLVPQYLSTPLNDPGNGRVWGYGYGRDIFAPLASYIMPRCNMTRTPTYYAQLGYESELKKDSDYFRSCPDGRAWDSVSTTKPSKDRSRGAWIFDDKVMMAVGDKSN